MRALAHQGPSPFSYLFKYLVAQRGRQMDRTTDEAVSPVVATILLVGIAVTAGAGVYVWAGGFGADEPVVKFPQFVLVDHKDPCTLGVTDSLFILEHVGGDPLDWSDYKVEVLDGDADHADVLEWGAGVTGLLPSGAFAVTDVLDPRETTDVCTAGAKEFWTVRIIDVQNEARIVFERELFVS